jgi:hypothetical protein
VEPDAQFPEDQVGQPAGRPQVGVEPVLSGRLGQPAEHLLLLVGGQEPGATGRGLGLQAIVPGRPVPRDTLLDGHRMDAEERGHVLLRPTLAHALIGETLPAVSVP